MNESLPPSREPAPPPPAGRPFTGEPRRAPSGRSRPLLIGCGIVIVLLGIAGIVLVAKAKDLLAWTMGQIESQVVAALPGDVTPAEKARVQRGFAAALDHIRDGKVDPPALYALRRQLTKAQEKASQGKLTHDDVLDLLSALERVGGLLPAPGSQEPAGPDPPTRAAKPPGSST